MSSVTLHCRRESGGSIGWGCVRSSVTHFHVDLLAGHIELRNQAGARICPGQRADAAFEHTAPKEGDVIEFSDVRIQTMETPGHTPKGISLLVFDLAASDAVPNSNIVPNAVLTGDTLFKASIATKLPTIPENTLTCGTKVCEVVPA